MDANNRKLLDEIVSDKNEKNWYVPELFKMNTLQKLPSDLRVIEIPPVYNKNYNCFIYALGLQNNQEIITETKGFIYSAFVQYLIDLEEIKSTKGPIKGCFIFYRNLHDYPGEITHAGIVLDDLKVISKWSWGPVIIHNVLDVPLSWGNNIEYYQSISKEKSLDFYNKYKKYNSNV